MSMTQWVTSGGLRSRKIDALAWIGCIFVALKLVGLDVGAGAAMPLADAGAWVMPEPAWFMDGGVGLFFPDAGGRDALPSNVGWVPDGGLMVDWVGDPVLSISGVLRAEVFSYEFGTGVDLESSETHPLEVRRDHRILAYLNADGVWVSPSQSSPKVDAGPGTAEPSRSQGNAVDGFAGGVSAMGLAVLVTIGGLSLRERRRRRLYGEKPLLTEGQPVGWKPGRN